MVNRGGESHQKLRHRLFFLELLLGGNLFEVDDLAWSVIESNVHSLYDERSVVCLRVLAITVTRKQGVLLNCLIDATPIVSQTSYNCLE